ncbi:MAG: 23S rRNA (guanosine(2251)-2'-O)-methyltransferase RlmB [Chloroflexi bacterium]|nr:23S rRNA (guanosine(2251)-2'-O)-methyltransferase RlmB [Chloroflexota bacterium]
MADIIAGRNPVIEALKADRPINRVLIDKRARGHGAIAEILSLAGDRTIPVEFVERSVLERLFPAGNSQSVIAYVASKEYATLDELLAIPKEKGESALYVIIDGIEDPQNLGAILRTCEATGVHGVIVRSRRAVGLTPAVAKTSAGAIEYIPVARVANIAQTIEMLKKQNIWVVGIDMGGKIEYTGVDLTLPTAIVIGGEGGGMSDLVKAKCDVLAFIPMKGKIESLNASVAAAVVMYEVVRQRGGRQGADLPGHK